MFRTALVTGLMALAVPIAAFGQAEGESYSTSVRLLVGESEIGNVAENYIEQELRSLGDVTLTESEAEWTIEVLAYAPTFSDGQLIGVAVSLVVLRHVNEAFVDELYRRREPNIVTVEDHVLRFGGEEDLRRIFREFVAGFDVEFLEPERVLWETTRDARRESEEEAD